MEQNDQSKISQKSFECALDVLMFLQKYHLDDISENRELVQGIVAIVRDYMEQGNGKAKLCI